NLPLILGVAANTTSNFFGGDVAELLLYNRSLSETDRAQVEGYLQQRYFAPAPPTQVATPTISPNGGPFATSVEVTLATTTSGAELRYTLDGTDPTTSSTLYTGAFTLTVTTTLKAQGFKSGLSPSAITQATFTKQTTPGPIPTTGLAVWLKADTGLITDATGQISAWANQAPTGPVFSLTQATSTKRPLVVPDVLNGQPVVRFDGTDDTLQGPELTSVYTNGQTLVAVVQATAAKTQVLMGQRQSGTSGTWSVAAFSDDRVAYTTGTLFVDDLDDAAIQIIERRMASPSSPDALVHMRVLGGAVSGVANDSTAFGHRDRRALIWLITPFADLTETERHN
ncbi:MAG: chitobiase/beta-hexosaminidase C-terminal domain-containing protein, partial [Chloroflexota bacterium]